MVGCLLLFILMCSVHEIQPQVLYPPKLTVNPAVITETDSVTLNCQTPSSVSVSQCFIYTGEQENFIGSSCLRTLKGADLLSMTRQSSPAVIEVKCYYSVKLEELNSPSPHSETSSITIHTLRQPKLTVNPSVITQKDVVTLNCEAPSSVPVPECYFNTLREESPKNLPCLTTLKATELLEMFHQSSTSVVEVICCYLAKFGENKYASPYSDTTSVTIHSSVHEIQPQVLYPPKLTVNPAVITETDSVTLNCQTPSSVSVSQCFIYTGRQENFIGFSCLRTLKGADLLSMTRQSSPAVIEVKCYYTIKLEELNSPSPHSETSSIIIHNVVERESSVVPTQSPLKMTSDVVERESSVVPTQSPLKMTSESRMMQTKSTTIMSTALTVGGLSFSTAETTAKQPSGLTVSRTSKTNGFISTSLTPVKPTSVDQILDGCSTRPSLLPPLDKASKTFIWKLIVGVAGFGVTIGVILLILVLLSNKRRTERHSQKRTQAIVTDDSMCMRNLNHRQLLPAGNNEAYSLITSVPGVDCPTDSEKLKRQEYHNEDSDIYHVYSTIPEEPPLSVSKDMVYSTVQAH